MHCDQKVRGGGVDSIQEREKKKKKKYLRFPHKLPAEIGFAPTFFESLANNGLTLVSKMPTCFVTLELNGRHVHESMAISSSVTLKIYTIKEEEKK